MAAVAKAKFEKEKAQVLKSLPDEIKGVFGTVGFTLGDDDDDDCKQMPYMQPVLIISPYDVAPKPVRDIYWMHSYSKAKSSKAKLKKLDHLVYVYGSDNPNDCYNFVSQNDFVTFEEGQKQGFDVLPEAIASKSEADRTESEAKLVRALAEMKADLDKLPTDRKHGSPFLEHYEKLSAKEAEDAEPPVKKQKSCK